MNKFLLWSLISFCSMGTWAQNTIGMTINKYNNWGTGITFSDYLKNNPGNPGLDSATQAPVYENATKFNSGFLIGVNYKMLGTDTNSWKGKWSRNISFYIGYGGGSKASAYQQQVYDINLPYTSIFYGDTTTVLLDSVVEAFHTVSARQGVFTQLGFGMNRVIRTKSRVTFEIGAGIHLGMGQYATEYQHNRYFNYLQDSTFSYSFVQGSSTTYQMNLKSENYYTGQLALNLGVIFPIAKDDDNWWVSLHTAVGVGGMYLMDKFYTRMTLVPTLGVNYRLGSKVPVDEYR
ncbi:MAG: hypothetical protein IT221_09290 [Fluviicola sp.]|nr:hypothetical protein [Fluviicola sp.]